jgi:hypothetical protein
MKRVVVRPSTYRRKPGFTIREYIDGRPRSVIFTETRTSAERIRAKLHADEEIALADFAP